MAKSMPDPATILAEVPSRLVGRRRIRSPIRLWLESAYDEIQAQSPVWYILAQKLAAAGLRDVNGNVPTSFSLQAAWNRICNERGDPASQPKAQWVKRLSPDAIGAPPSITLPKSKLRKP